jgi:chitinase
MRQGDRKGGTHDTQRTFLLAGLGTATVACLAAYALMSPHFAGRLDEQWFGGYVDVTISPHHDFQDPKGAGRNVVLAFAVADSDQPCRAKWGSVYTADEAVETGLDQRIAAFRENGGQVALSFGGALNHELATVCTDVEQLTDAYRRAVNRYGVSTVDLDIEEHNLPNTAASKRRALAMATLQAEYTRSGRPLDVWLTLPASPAGLTPDGAASVQQMLAAGVDLAGVNIMTMNYGESRPSGTGMLEASIQAAQATHSQLNSIYREAGQELSTAELWRKIGLTPMIGQNEMETDVFELADARSLNAFALDTGVGRVSMWSLNRDRSCPAAERIPGQASAVCSGIDQGEGAFEELLGHGFSGKMP